MKSWLSRILVSLLLLAGLYEIGINVALNLPATRQALNQLQPEQFAVDWQRAWSWYPLRIGLRGLAADGQTPSEQWQIDAEQAAVSVSLLPLLRGEIVLHNLDLDHLDLRLRPRPAAGADQLTDVDPLSDQRESLSEFYPVIRHRDPNAVAEPAPEAPDSALVLEIDNIHLQGIHRFWVSHIRGELPGEVRGSFRMDTQAGKLSLKGGVLNLRLQALDIAGRQPLLETAQLRGQIDIAPFRPSELEGLQFLRIADIDAEIDLPVEKLDFLVAFLPPLKPMALDGQGRLNGHLRLAGGEFLGGTDLTVVADALSMKLGQFIFSGDGLVDFRVNPDNESEGEVAVRFDRFVTELEADATKGPDRSAQRKLMFTGYGLTARMDAIEVDPSTTSTATKVDQLADEITLSFALEIPAVRVPDLTTYNRLIPPAWNLRLLGGTGVVRSVVNVTPNSLALDLDLTSDNADLRYRDYHAATDMLLELRARVDDQAGTTLRLDGTRLELSDAELGTADAKAASPWEAEFVVQGGTLKLPTPDADAGARTGARAETIARIANELAEEGFGVLLSKADGDLSAILTVSELDWIAALLNRPLGLRLTGAAEIDAQMQLHQGLLIAGSEFRLSPERLSLALLQHQIDGQGKAALMVKQGGKHPSLEFSVNLNDGRIRRRDEPEPSIGNARLDAKVSVSKLGAKSTEAAQVDLRLHEAEVQDMAVYNAYLPDHAPIEFVQGAARLIGNLALTNKSAKGQLLLTTQDVELALGDQRMTGDLQLEVLVHDGAPDAMRFDVTGSSLRLDRFRVNGPIQSDQREHWSARLQFEDAQVIWNKPLELNLKADLTIKDTRPFLAIVDNLRSKPGWFDHFLTAENLAGHIKVNVKDQHAIIEDAMLSSTEFGVHAKALSSADGHEGMLMLRWKNLTGAVAMREGKQQFLLADAPHHFDAYQPGSSSLGHLMHRPSDPAARNPVDASQHARPEAAPHRAGPKSEPSAGSRGNLFLDGNF